MYVNIYIYITLKIYTKVTLYIYVEVKKIITSETGDLNHKHFYLLSKFVYDYFFFLIKFISMIIVL